MRAGTCATSSRSSPEVPSATQVRCRQLAVLSMFSTCSTRCCEQPRAVCRYRMARPSCEGRAVKAGRIAGRVALVTGAARGIGRACALRLAEEGADVAALDIGAAIPTVPYKPSSTQQLEETASAVRALGRKCLTLVADVRDGAAMREAVARAVGELGSVDILVTAAGIDSWGHAWELTDDQWNAMLAVNLTGVWQSAKAVSPHMISKRSGA